MSNEIEPPHLTSNEFFFYQDLREKWKHEDHLINQRVTWLLSSQGFLLAGYGGLAAIRAGLRSSGGHPPLTIEVVTAALIGISIPIAALLVLGYLKKGILAAIMAMKRIKQTRAERVDKGLFPEVLHVDVLDQTTDEGSQAPVRLATGLGPSSFRVEPNRQNGRSSSSPVGMWAGCL